MQNIAAQIMNTGKSLKDFQQTGENDLFQEAKQLPYFFKQNLVDQSRVIKYFPNDPQANLRVFYYQYLKQCFQFDNSNYQSYVNKIYQILSNPQFSFKFPYDSKGQFFKDKQFKRLLIEFLNYLSKLEITVNKALNIFPVMDFVLVCFFRSFLIMNKKSKQFDNFIQRGTLFQFLTSYFNIEATVHDKCMKFVETDIYVYEQNPYQVYLVYIDYEKDIQRNQYKNKYYNKNIISNNSLAQSHQKSMTLNLNKKNDIVKSNNNYNNFNNMIKNYSQSPINKTNQPTEQQKKRKEMLSYMGTSDIYDFVDYTNPSKNLQQNNTIKSNTLSNLIKQSNMKKSNHIPSKSHDQTIKAQNLSPRMQTSIFNNHSSPKKQVSVKFASEVIQFGNQTNLIKKILPQKQPKQLKLNENFIYSKQKQSLSNNINSQGKQSSSKYIVNQKCNLNLNNQNNLSYQQTDYQTRYQSSHIYPNILKNQAKINNQLNNVPSQLSKNRQFMENDKYNLDSVKPNLNNLYQGNQDNKVNTFIKPNISISNYPGLKTNSIFINSNNSNQIKPYNSNHNDFSHQFFQDKIKKMSNNKNQLDLDHKSYTATNFYNNHYQETNIHNKSKTVNFDEILKPDDKSVISKQISKQINISNPSQTLGSSASQTMSSTFYDRNSSINQDEQFTNSFILQCLNETQRNNIKNMKMRARDQRKSVGEGIM